MKRAAIVVLIVAVIGAGVGAYYIRRSAPELAFMTGPVTRGDVVDAVASTGTLQAVITVQVGSQVSGNISWLGADFNSIVKKGQVVAKLDPALFEATVQQQRANLAKANADVIQSQATVEHSKVALTDAQQKYKRMKDLFDQKLETQADLDAAKTAVDSATADVQSTQAALNSARAGVTQSQASLNQAQVNLDHTIITAPVDGIITQRSVDVGQTVAASMTAPTVFIIAADLTKMQVSANIDEADVGRIRPGQRATFRVDAYPTDTFTGVVAQIRLNPIVVQNVTTYATMLNVDNTDLRLKPGMTANLRIEVSRKSNVLRVPNAAVRFRPSADVFAALNEPVPPDLIPGRGGRGGRGSGGGGGGRNASGSNAQAGQAPPASQAPGASSAQSGQGADSGQGGRGGVAGGSGSGRGGGRNADPAQRMAQFQAMSPDQQQQFIARMKARGQDTSAFEAAATKPTAATKPGAGGAPATGGAPPSALFQPKYGLAQSAATIDALFAPLVPVETRGRVWLFADKQLKPVNVRLGITDGTNTEVLSNELQENTQVVTGVTGLGSTRQTGAPAAANPFQQGGRGGPGGGGGRGF
jgi:HlyD family secretion protein